MQQMLFYLPALKISFVFLKKNRTTMQVYLDYNATTPIDEGVAKAMRPYLDQYFGNPSSSHRFGIEARKAVEKARHQVAELLACNAGEIVFTSGGSESNNYAIKGVAYAHREKGNHIITSSIEHPAVSEVCKYLEKNGFRISTIPVNDEGIIDLVKLKKAITPSTILITVMHANNEIGTIQPIEEIAKIAKEHGILLHSDGAQSTGKYPTNLKEMGVDLFSIAGHKLYAPKGIGALYIKDGTKLEKLIHGADHEQNYRAGTENVLEIVGLGAACEIAGKQMEKQMQHMQKMRDLLHEKIKEQFPDVRLNGHPEKRLPNTLNLSFPGVEANILLDEMESKGIAASAGAACHTDNIDVSPVLEAIKLDTKFAMGTIRFSTGRHTTTEEINYAADTIKEVLLRLRPDANQVPVPEDFSDGIKLTHFTQGLGCACKLRPQALENILKEMPVHHYPNVLIDTKDSDDAAVYKINDETALVQTLDFFTPIVDDPYDFGAIAACNALSDIYAMGAKPVFALNIVGFPSNRLPMDVLKSILKGASDKATEAGIPILGGHTIDDPEPKYGMVVSGLVHPNKLLSNGGAKVGDAIVLTKPLGTGIISTAMKRGMADASAIKTAKHNMSMLNKYAADLFPDFNIHACTDVTGFGLLGHLYEVVAASHVTAELQLSSIPLIPEARDYAIANIIPGGSMNNLEYYGKHVLWDDGIGKIDKILLADAQTSGGLITCMPESQADKYLTLCKENHMAHASVIGKIVPSAEAGIIIKKS